MRSLFGSAPRANAGNALLRVILIAAAVLLFGNMLLGMVIKIAFGALALAVNIGLFLLLIGAIFYFIRAMSGKAESK